VSTVQIEVAEELLEKLEKLGPNASQHKSEFISMAIRKAQPMPASQIPRTMPTSTRIPGSRYRRRTPAPRQQKHWKDCYLAR